VLIVTEPTVSGIHDLERVAKLAAHFNVPAMVCVNKFDLNPDLSWSIEKIAKEMGLSCIGHIPFDPTFTMAMVEAQSIIEYASNSIAGRAVKEIWERALKTLGLQQQAHSPQLAAGFANV
jgi:MinD superfamily P-loop ATPase